MKKLSKRIWSILLCVAMLVSTTPLSTATAATPLAQSAVANTVTDPGTADSWEHMMGTDVDGNRYAGRVWVDKSVYKDGDTVKFNNKGDAGSTFQVGLKEDEAFQIVFSALGSTMTTTETSTSASPMDVVLVLDDSTSMDDIVSQNTTRLQKLIEASNKLLADLLTAEDIRIGIVAYNSNAIQVLPFGKYNNGIQLRVLNNKYSFDENNRTDKGGTIQAFDNSGTRLYNNTAGYSRGTNLQAGFDAGMRMLEGASNAKGRTPVAIVLTDGSSNTAAQQTFYDIASQTPVSVFNGSVAPGVAVATLLTAAYRKARVEDVYGTAPMVYGVGVDIAGDAAANAIINPADTENGFNSRNSSSNITTAYELYTNWSRGNTIRRTENYFGNYQFTFDHGYTGVTRQDIQNNIHYVDTYYPVAGVDLEGVFDQIYEELSSGVFNPISSSSSTSGGTGVDDTPLIYVDFIGQHMEIKEIQAVTLFGNSYGVVKNANGTYSVTGATGTNPTTNEAWNTAEDIKIAVTEESDGTQKLEIRINQEILPIIMEKVDSNTVGNVTNATITEYGQSPLRVYYTVGIASDVLLPNGEVDVSKLQGYTHIDNAAGTVSFYSNRFGVMNPADNAGAVTEGDAHVGFKPSPLNRFYYHQANQGIFTAIINKSNGSAVTIPENNEYGIVWNENQYDLSWMTYDQYKAARDTDKVYTYVSYYRPTPSAADAANAAEEITYLVYTNWGYLKESVAFYDDTAKTYLNNGKAIAEGQVESTVAAYLQSHPGARLYAVLGKESLRTSRLHNMTVDKVTNDTQTATLSYAPEYTHDTASDHNGNDVVVWLGNNGKLTVEVDTGIALTKAVTEAIGDPDDTYELTVTVPAGVVAQPVVRNADGADVTAAISAYSGNVLTVNVKAGETVYISGIPGGTECIIGEVVAGDYYIASKTDTVRIPLVSEALNGATQFAPAVVTNAPNKYGQLTVVKDIDHDLTVIPAAMADKVFTFKVQLPIGLAGKTYDVDKSNASLFTGDKVTVGQDGSFTVDLKDNESITILNLPEGTTYEVAEISTVAGYTNTTGVVGGTINPGGDHDAHFVNAYEYTPIKPAVTVTGTKTLNDVDNTYIDNEDFVFVLSRYTGSGYAEVARTTAKAGGSYEFRLDALLTDELGLGDHYFRITEESGTTDGMTYDSSRGLFVVHITDSDANGTLEYSVENTANTTVAGTTVTKNFTNIYDVQRIHADINITKELTNNTGAALPLNMFRFVLKNTANPDNAQIEDVTVTTDASGKATIRLPELAVGQYTYTLTEETGTLAGMTYDTTPRSITVTVTETGGVLTAAVEIDGTATNAVTFKNEYKLNPTTHTISGTKKLDGRAPANGEFSFELYETDSSFNITGNPKETVSNKGESFSFSAITYDRVGTHYYSVKELDTDVPSVTYDTTHYHITVTVGVDGENLTKQVTVNKIGYNNDVSGNVVFINTYKPTPTEYALGGLKILHGRAPKDGEFSFELYEGDVLKETVTNKGDGSFSFQRITYREVGTHTYTIKEKAGTVSGVRYDGVNAPVTVTVTVTDNNGALRAAASVANTDIRFENTYTAAPATVTFHGTKEFKGGVLADNLFAFEFYKTDNSFDITQSTAQMLDSARNVGAAFSFAETLSTTGTHYFVILEDTAAPMEGVVYDRTRHKFAVQVSDIGDGQLRSEVTNMTTGTSGTDVVFTNATFDEAVEKEVYQANSSTSIDGKKVKAGDELTYFITYTNYTGEDVVADIMDTIPQHTSYVEGSASHEGTYAGTHLNWILNVAKGESVTVCFTVKVDETEVIVANTAVVRDGVNTYNTNQVVNHTVEENAKKDVFFAADTAVSIDGKTVKTGDELVYTIRFTNTSGKTVDIKISDKIPAHAAYVEGSADNGGVLTNGELVWNLADVPAWSTVTVSFKVKVVATETATITNKALVEEGNSAYITNEVSNKMVKEPAPSGEAPSIPQPAPVTPQTGDGAQLLLWVVLLVVSGGALLTMAVYTSRKKEN